MTRTSARVALGIAMIAAVRTAAGQAAPPIHAQYRADVIAGRGTAGEVGLGAVMPLGTYVRASIEGAGGATWQHGTARASGRVDAIGRFLLDPYREAPIGVSLGGGVSLPYVDGDKRVRPYVVAVVDIEGRMRGRLTPALQIGLGGGTRVGVVLRSSQARWR